MFKLPDDINELEYVVTYKQHHATITYFYVYLNTLITFHLSLTSNYIINIYQFKDRNIFSNCHTVDELKYEQYKYETHEINNFLSKTTGELITDTKIAKNIIETKFTRFVRKSKIKKLLC
jgi:hypothetical protein